MKKSKRLQPICDFTKRKEDEAAKVVARASQNLNSQKQRLVDLKNYRAEYAQQFAQAGGAGLNASRMRDYQNFMGNLSKVIDQQQSAIQVLEREFEAKKRQWLAERSRTKALTTVQDRYVSKETLQEEKKLQKEIDDRYSRSTSN